MGNKEVTLPIAFHSPKANLHIIGGDAEVVYKGNKEIITKPATDVRFKNNKYVCKDQRTYDFLIDFMKTRTVVSLMKDVKKPATGAGLKLSKTILNKMVRDDLVELCQSLNIIVEENMIKKDLVDAIFSKQEGVKKPKATTHAKGQITARDNAVV